MVKIHKGQRPNVDQSFEFLVIGLLSTTDSLSFMLLKQLNKVLKNFAVNVDLLVKRLNETNVKIPALTELLEVCAAEQTLMGENGGSSICIFFNLLANRGLILLCMYIIKVLIFPTTTFMSVCKSIFL